MRVIGGLGNQLHCYAFGRALAVQNGALLYLDAESGYWNDPFGRMYLLDQFFGLNARYTSTQPNSKCARQFFMLGLKLKSYYSRLLPLSMKLIVLEGTPPCYKEDIHLARYIATPYFIGYWASYRYYQGIEKELRHELKPTVPKHPSIQELLSQIRSARLCFIHWRSF